MELTRRGFFLGAAATLAAPAIAKAEFIMPVRRIIMPKSPWILCDGRTLDRRDYAALFQVIGRNYGGSGHKFQLPNILHGPGSRSEIVADHIPHSALPVGMIVAIAETPGMGSISTSKFSAA